MPITDTFLSSNKTDSYRTITFATKEELLDFVNQIREAGGADILDALLPGVPMQSYSCLIARGLNFKCSVGGDKSSYRNIPHPDDPQNSYMWYMSICGSHSETKRIGDAICNKLNLNGVYREFSADVSEYIIVSEYMIELPLHIGNAAYAFDRRHPEFSDLISEPA